MSSIWTEEARRDLEFFLKEGYQVPKIAKSIGLSPASIYDLQNVLHRFYQEKGLVPEGGGRITGLPSNRYPVFSELLTFIAEEMEDLTRLAETETEVKKKLYIDELTGLKKIHKALRNLVDNYGSLFDGHTSIDNITDEKVVTFDISTIKDMGNVFAAQLFNMTYFCWDNCVSNGALMKELYESGQIALEDITRFLIIVDESHRWVNTQYPFILDMVIVMLREMRKYFGGMTLASQSFRDYVPQGESDKVVEKLKVVFELTQYKFIFRQDSSVLPLIDRIFGSVLSPWQRDRIPMLGKGECILSISGDRNIYFKVWLSKNYEERLFAGGL